MEECAWEGQDQAKFGGRAPTESKFLQKFFVKRGVDAADNKNFGSLEGKSPRVFSIA